MRPLRIGAVAYDPTVVTIWEGFKRYLGHRGLEVDHVLFSNYESQVEAHLAGVVDVAWNSPLAWVRSRRLAEAAGSKVTPLVMRDADRDLTSAILVRSDDDASSVDDLDGRRVGVGAVDSPQATLIPSLHLAEAGVRFVPVPHDLFAGKHGDHGTAERMAARALAGREVDAAAVLTSNLAAFEAEGVVKPGALKILAETEPFDHCVMTVASHAPDAETRRLGDLLLAMSYEDAEARSLCELEGLKRWEEGRADGFELLERAVDASGFYDAAGRITAEGYRY